MKTISLKNFSHLLAPRKPDTHKGDYGHVLIIGGDIAYSGAPRLAALAAARSGAGLVSIATHPSHAMMMTIQQPELMSHAVNTAEALQALIATADVIAIGMGLGQSSWSTLLLETSLNSHKPMIIDADALNLLAQQHSKPYPNTIFTPHPGEAAGLLNCTADAIQQDRQQAITTLQLRYQNVVILKGHHSLVAAADNTIRCCQAGNPGMASGGMGDLLSGIIAALLAQGLSPSDAAATAVCVHATAGDLATQQQGERGLLATDLLPFIRQLLNPSR